MPQWLTGPAFPVCQVRRLPAFGIVNIRSYRFPHFLEVFRDFPVVNQVVLFQLDK